MVQQCLVLGGCHYKTRSYSGGHFHGPDGEIWADLQPLVPRPELSQKEPKSGHKYILIFRPPISRPAALVGCLLFWGGTFLAVSFFWSPFADLILQEAVVLPKRSEGTSQSHVSFLGPPFWLDLGNLHAWAARRLCTRCKCGRTMWTSTWARDSRRSWPRSGQPGRARPLVSTCLLLGHILHFSSLRFSGKSPLSCHFVFAPLPTLTKSTFASQRSILHPSSMFKMLVSQLLATFRAYALLASALGEATSPFRVALLNLCPFELH